MDTYKQKPLLSVRLMTYNHEKFIHQAMESILSQKVDFPVEVVVGDDFSTDNTLSIIRKFKSTKKSIHIHILERAKGDEYWKKRQAQGRIYNFINILENCKGKYIALLDGDDYWTDPLKLQKQVDFLEANPEYSLVVGGFKQIDVDTGKEEVVIKDIPESDEKGFDIDLEIFFRGWYTKTLTLMFRKDFFDVEEFRKYKYSRDVHLNYILLKKGLGYYMKEVFGVYHRHGGGVFSAISEIKKINDGYLIFEELNKVNSHDLLIKNKFIKQREKVLKKKSFREDNRIRVFRLLYDQLMTSSDFKSFKKNTKYILQALNLWK